MLIIWARKGLDLATIETGTRGHMTHYLVIGHGRWARHLLHSLNLLGVDHSQWTRQDSPLTLTEHLKTATHVWIAISDSAIQDFYLTELKPRFEILGLRPALNTARKSGLSLESQKRSTEIFCLHSSGVLEIPELHSVHPLMSFSHDLYPDSLYLENGFGFVTTSPVSKEFLIPGFRQKLTMIQLEQKAFYHSLCVLAGNCSVLLWQKFFAEMQKMNLPQDILMIYFKQVSQNIQTSPFTALTGPLVRNDQVTLKMDLMALGNDPFQIVLASFVSAYRNGQNASPSPSPSTQEFKSDSP